MDIVYCLIVQMQQKLLLEWHIIIYYINIWLKLSNICGERCRGKSDAWVR